MSILVGEPSPQQRGEKGHLAGGPRSPSGLRHTKSKPTPDRTACSCSRKWLGTWPCCFSFLRGASGARALRRARSRVRACFFCVCPPCWVRLEQVIQEKHNCLDCNRVLCKIEVGWNSNPFQQLPANNRQGRQSFITQRLTGTHCPQNLLTPPTRLQSIHSILPIPFPFAAVRWGSQGNQQKLGKSEGPERRAREASIAGAEVLSGGTWPVLDLCRPNGRSLSDRVPPKKEGDSFGCVCVFCEGVHCRDIQTGFVD